MLDHTSLSASQDLLPHLSQQDQRNKKRRKNPTIVTNLSASIEKLQKNMLSLNETAQEALDITSSIVLVKILETEYLWQEQKAQRFLSFVGQLQSIERWYTLRERDEILQFLEKYPPLNSLLLEIRSSIVTYFPASQFFLQVVADPEAISDDQETANGNGELVISIVTRMAPREAFERLKQFYKNWWLETPDRAGVKEKISFNLECI